MTSEMEISTTSPSPPNLEGLIWRHLDQDDLAALVDLAGKCHLADGGLSFMFEPDILMDEYYSDKPGAAIGGFAPDGRLNASAAVHTYVDAQAQRARIVGQVLPDLRVRGIGDYLMRWSEAQARSLLAGAGASQKVLQVATEALTDLGDRLYRSHGFACVFESLVMRRDLLQPLPVHPLPPGVTIATWQPDLAEQFFYAYDGAFHDRPGFPGWSAAKWIHRVTQNDLIPEWSLLARSGHTPLGFVIGNIDLTTEPPGGFIWQIGVIHTQRRRGLGSALMFETMRRMQADGAPWAQLTVNRNNPGAIQAYKRLGFTTIGRRARYERLIQ